MASAGSSSDGTWRGARPPTASDRQFSRTAYRPPARAEAPCHACSPFIPLPRASSRHPGPCPADGTADRRPASHSQRPARRFRPPRRRPRRAGRPNALREDVGAPPLAWSNDLAPRGRYARHLAARNCRLRHDNSPQGENLYAAWGSPQLLPKQPLEDASLAWGEEITAYRGHPSARDGLPTTDTTPR